MIKNLKDKMAKGRSRAVKKANGSKRTKYPNYQKGYGKGQQTTQTGGMLPGLIIGLVKAKKKKKHFNVGKYISDSFGKRAKVINVAKGKKVPTPGNTKMDTGSFFKSGFFGIG